MLYIVFDTCKVELIPAIVNYSYTVEPLIARLQDSGNALHSRLQLYKRTSY